MTSRGKNLGLAAKIKQLRTELGYSQSKLAQKAGVSRSYISLLELGMVGRPSAERILKLAEALHVDDNVLYRAAGYVKGPLYEIGLDVMNPRLALVLQDIGRAAQQGEISDKNQRAMADLIRPALEALRQSRREARQRRNQQNQE